LPGFFLIVDEPEKSSVVCPGSQVRGIAGNRAIGTIDKSIECPKTQGELELLIVI
jgi:hypothetical protein